MSALGTTIKKRREELQEVTHTNAVEMDSIKTKAADAVAKAKEDHEKKVYEVNRCLVCCLWSFASTARNCYCASASEDRCLLSRTNGGFTENHQVLDTFVCLTVIYTLMTPTQIVETFHRYSRGLEASTFPIAPSLLCPFPSHSLIRKGRALTERIERLAKETGEAAELHQQEETAARKKKAKVEVELTTTVGKYDRDMTAKTAQIEEIKVRTRHMNFNGSPVEPYTPYYAQQ